MGLVNKLGFVRSSVAGLTALVGSSLMQGCGTVDFSSPPEQEGQGINWLGPGLSFLGPLSKSAKLGQAMSAAGPLVNQQSAAQQGRSQVTQNINVYGNQQTEQAKLQEAGRQRSIREAQERERIRRFEEEKEKLRKSYSTAFLRIVEKHDTPNVREPDELEGRGDNFDLEKIDSVCFGTLTKKTGYVRLYLYKEGEDKPIDSIITSNIIENNKIYIFNLISTGLRERRIAGKILANFRVSDTRDERDFGESFDSYHVWLFGNPIKSEDAKINTGRTPYSTAFIDIVDKHNDPDVIHPDELFGNGDTFNLRKVNEIKFATEIKNRSGDIMHLYISKASDDFPLIKTQEVPITRDSEVRHFTMVAPLCRSLGITNGNYTARFKVRKADAPAGTGEIVDSYTVKILDQQ